MGLFDGIFVGALVIGLVVVGWKVVLLGGFVLVVEIRASLVIVLLQSPKKCVSE